MMELHDGETWSDIPEDDETEAEVGETWSDLSDERSDGAEEIYQALVDAHVRPNFPQRKSVPRVDWSSEFYRTRMDSAIRKWSQVKTSNGKPSLIDVQIPTFKSTGRKWKDDNGKIRSMRDFCRTVGVPYSTFHRRLGSSDPYAVPKTGRPGLFNIEDRGY